MVSQVQSVLILVPHFEPALLGGGPIRSIVALLKRVPPDRPISVLTSAFDLRGSEPLPVVTDKWTTWNGRPIYYNSRRSLGNHLLLLFKERKDAFDIVYLNSLFSLRYSILPVLLHRLGIFGDARLLLAPRGELDPGALSLKRTKKRIFIWLYRLLRLDHAITWHASTAEERAHIYAAFPRAEKVIVRVNDTDLPSTALPSTTYEHDALRFVFLSRIVPKKGLDILLKGLGGVSAPCSLDVWGTEEDPGYVRRCRELAAGLPRHISVNFRGFASPEQTVAILHEYDYFMFPTLAENFGHVIAESFAASTPVLVSANTPWSDAAIRGGGGVVQPNTPEGWASHLNLHMEALKFGRDDASVRTKRVYEEWYRDQETPDVFSLFEEARWSD